MPNAITEVRTLIEDRLRELEAEEKRLRAALANLTGDRHGSTRRASARRGAVRQRAPAGQRQAEFLAVLERNPGAKVPAIAEEMRLPAPQVYGLARRLHQTGRIGKRRGGGYALRS